MKQIPCRLIATAWIKVCHERKQASHPYNGGKLKDRSVAVSGYPGHLTKPDYWPDDEGWPSRGCRHTEPSHLKKHGISLLDRIFPPSFD